MPETIFLSAVSLGLLAWSLRLFHSTVLGGLAAGFVGFAIGGLAVLGPASGECPVCKKTLHGLFAIATSDFDRCPHCLCYFRRADNAEVPRDLVADVPAFSVPIDQGATLPNLCCVCGKPAARVEEVVHSTEGRLSHAGPQVLKQTFKIPVPYCGEHNEAVDIWNEDLAPSAPLVEGGQQTTDHRWVIRVRSYGFYRAAVKG